MISIVIITYESSPYLKTCLGSIMDKGNSNLEIVVVDNGSRDGSAEFARSKYPHITLIEFVAVVHHIADGWSTRVFAHELAVLYDAFSRRADVPLPPLRIQYADYASWQHRWPSGEVLDAHLEYWKTALAGAPPILEFPTDHPRPPAQTFNGSFHEFSIPEEMAGRLQELCRRESSSIFMALLAAFKVLLSRYSGQTDITVGTPIANRTHADLEALIGFFVNTLVMRTDLSGRPTFRELLRRVRDVAFGAYAHQEAPLDKVVDAVRPERSLDHIMKIKKK